MATRVSWGVADITNSLGMKAPQSASPHSYARRFGTRLRSPKPGQCHLIYLLSHAMRSQILNLLSLAQDRSTAQEPKPARDQLTNRLRRTFITRPKAKNTNSMAEPP